MMDCLTVSFQIHNLAGPVVMLVYPLYASMKAIESPFTEDDAQWLTYWVLYSFFQLIELTIVQLWNWFPLLYSIKLAAFCWLVLPNFRGAHYIYENYWQRYIGGPNVGRSYKLSDSERHLIQRMSPEARAEIAAFLSDYGPGPFDLVVLQGLSEFRKRRRKRSK